MFTIHEQLLSDMADAAENPEGLEVPVVGTDDERLVRQAAPMVARRLFPDRSLGEVLWLERIAEGIWTAVVEDRGARTSTTRAAVTSRDAILYGRSYR